MITHGPPGQDGMLVLRRQPARVGGGRPEGGYTDAYELICRDCGDDPELDYHQVSAEFQRIRGPYPIAAGVEAYEHHAGQHETRRPMFEPTSR